MADLIDRQAALEAVSKGCQEWRGIFARCEENIKALPSADVPDTNVGDTISRQAAIDALKAKAVPLYKDPGCNDIWERDRTLDNAIDVIRGLPSAQPDLRNNKLFRNNVLQKTPETSDCYVRLSDLKKPIQRNPFDPEKGDIEGYMRYLKYNTDYTPLPCNYVPVVRCQDCKFASYEPCKDYVNVYVCNYNPWRRSQGGRYPDDYCSQAKRRTNG